MSTFKQRLIAGSGIGSGVVYNSWPLGYLLNPKIADKVTASGLEAVNQPYNWLFVGADIVTAVLIILAILLAFDRSRIMLISSLGLILFAVMTALSALIPLNCSVNVLNCGYLDGQVFNWHNFTGGLADVGLFVAMVGAILLTKSQTLRILDKWFLVLWTGFGLLFFVGVLPSVSRLSDINTLAIIWDEVYLVLSGVLIGLITLSYIKKDTEPAVTHN